jgi:hypothetical protein
MADFERIVRPVVFPNIRPAPARSLPPADDPEKGMCVITGGGSFPVQLSHSANVSTSKSKPVETERRVDEARVYQMDDDGTVNKDSYVDIEVANRITMLRQALTKQRGEDQRISEENYYKRLQEEKNIEIRKRDQIRKNEEQAARDAG